MTDDRARKLKQLRGKQLIEDEMIKALGEIFSEAVGFEYDKWKELVQSGIDVNGLDEISSRLKSLDKLEDLKSVAEVLREVKLSVQNMKPPAFPESIPLTGTEKLTTALDQATAHAKALQQEDIYVTYKAANSDETSESEKYFGFINGVGNWFILRETGDETKSWKYTSGKSNYTEAWGARRRGNYKLYSEISI